MNCGSSPTVDDRFTAFADPSRRTVLSTLCEQSPSGETPAASIETLIAELTSDCGARRTGDESVPDARESVTNAHIELVHVHLPVLERAGLAEREHERVHLTADPDVVERGLELAETFE